MYSEKVSVEHFKKGDRLDGKVGKVISNGLCSAHFILFQEREEISAKANPQKWRVREAGTV